MGRLFDELLNDVISQTVYSWIRLDLETLLLCKLVSLRSSFYHIDAAVVCIWGVCVFACVFFFSWAVMCWAVLCHIIGLCVNSVRRLKLTVHSYLTSDQHVPQKVSAALSPSLFTEKRCQYHRSCRCCCRAPPCFCPWALLLLLLRHCTVAARWRSEHTHGAAQCSCAEGHEPKLMFLFVPKFLCKCSHVV